MVLINELMKKENWKTTRKKTGYSIYFCKPPVGTKIKNELTEMSYTVGKADVVLCGTRQDLSVISEHELLRSYDFADNTCITTKKLEQKIINGCIHWTRIKPKATKLDSTLSYFVPIKYKNVVLPNKSVVNKTGVKHGIGDFIITNLVDGQLDLNNLTVVNGEVFVDTYDMRAYTGLVTNVVQIVEAPYPKYNFIPNLKVETAEMQKSEATDNKPDELPNLETTDFNIIAYKTFEYLKKNYAQYDYEIVDVVSSFSDNKKNYAKIDVIKEETPFARTIMSIDKNGYILVVIKNRETRKQSSFRAATLKKMLEELKELI